jgi:hypothetical protein
VKAATNSVKPSVFIGSSSEGLSVAYALQNNLENAAEITVWTQDVFRPSEYLLESLLKQLSIADIGVFVFSADDLVRMRGVEYAGVRDNVIFEFGLFVGQLGRDKSIIVTPKNDNPHLPSDLLGVHVLKFQPDRADGNLDAALGPASNKIRALMANVQPKATSIPRELKIPILERRDLLTNQQRSILNEIEARNQCTRDELASALPGMPIPELNYRLEQLKLLMFISEGKSSDIEATSRVYTLSEPYKRASINRITLRSDR